jgi:hypothetical protein
MGTISSDVLKPSHSQPCVQPGGPEKVAI